MSDSGETTATAPKRTRYLQKAFAMNPMWQADDILKLRRKALGLARVDEASEDDSSADRQQQSHAIRQHVKQIQHHFWTMPLDQLQRSLLQIDIKQLPELGPVVKRLRTAAACRGEFPKLATAKGMDLPLLNAFRRIVVLPPSEAGYIREQFIQSLQDRGRVKDVRRAIRVIEADYSILYGMERDWFSTLSQLKRPRAAGQESGGGGGFELPDISWLGWVGIFILLRVVLRVFIGFGD